MQSDLFPHRSFLFLWAAVSCFFLAPACSIEKKIGRLATADILEVPPANHAVVGISIYEPASGKYWFDHNGDKYFVPASNTKIPTCYAAMKYLGDSIPFGKLVPVGASVAEFYPMGDPGFLHPDYAQQPLLAQLRSYDTIRLMLQAWNEKRWGKGWSWDDYEATYMAERSLLPLYGNLAGFSLAGNTLHTIPAALNLYQAAELQPGFYDSVSGRVRGTGFTVSRQPDDNRFILEKAPTEFSGKSIPFRTTPDFVQKMLEDTLHRVVELVESRGPIPVAPVLYARPTDAILSPMMHRSDNFFAEQCLLMVSNVLLGTMNDQKVIDTLLQTDFHDLPQAPRWVDGSGLSRYNLFSPRDFVAILRKMQDEFGMRRIRNILPTGGEGTISSYYKSDSGYIYGKTGTLSGVVAFSGFLTTRKNRNLIFSVLVNNHSGSAADIRRAVERFLLQLREKY